MHLFIHSQNHLHMNGLFLLFLTTIHFWILMKVEVDPTWSILPRQECMSILILILEMSIGQSRKLYCKNMYTQQSNNEEEESRCWRYSRILMIFWYWKIPEALAGPLLYLLIDVVSSPEYWWEDKETYFCVSYTFVW